MLSVYVNYCNSARLRSVVLALRPAPWPDSQCRGRVLRSRSINTLLTVLVVCPARGTPAGRGLGAAPSSPRGTALPSGRAGGCPGSSGAGWAGIRQAGNTLFVYLLIYFRIMTYFQNNDWVLQVSRGHLLRFQDGASQPWGFCS